MAKMAKKLGIGCVGAIANKVTEIPQIDMIRSQLDDIILLGTLRYSKLLQEADLTRAPVFAADAEITKELEKAKDRLAELLRKPGKLPLTE